MPAARRLSVGLRNEKEEEKPTRRSKRPITSDETKEEEEDDGVKTRRLQKTKIENSPKCTLCKVSDEAEDLKSCSGCLATYHISRCLKYQEEFVENIKKAKLWMCARCVRCAKCSEFIADPSNIECYCCCKAWHGDCAPSGTKTSELYDGLWMCTYCCRKQKSQQTPPSKKNTPKNSPKKANKLTPISKNEIKLKMTDEEIEEIMKERNLKWDSLACLAGLASPTKSLSNIVRTSPKKQAAKKKGVQKMIKTNDDEPTTSLNYEDDDMSGMVTGFDASLFNQLTKSPSKTSCDTSDTLPTGQWIYMGGDKVSKSIGVSVYSEATKNAPIIYICKFCHHATHIAADYRIHWDNCCYRYPPGNEIYRKDNLSFFEVSGAEQKTYCRNLCRLAKLFISSKTLHHEVETFVFYILCEITTDGFVMVGYFSKERNPSKNNNLSCLLTLPTAQRMGYGRLLIDMSYALSRKELKIGSPEHPLSDLGILAYRGYWRSAILCYLRSIRNHHNVTIKEISQYTRIHPVDVVNQLLKDRLLMYKKGTYFIKTGKRAFKHPLSHTRRRYIDMSLLNWNPKPEDLKGLDPFRLNFYV